MSRDPPEMFVAYPLEDNLFEWHFTIRGGSDTPYESGLYHGRILLPPTYPHKPPDVVFLTPNGRFKVNEKICLSITGYHPEHWSAVWDIRAALTALIAFLPTPPNGAIGSLDYSDKERERLAKRSVRYCCPTCGMSNLELLPKKETCPEIDAKKEKKQLSDPPPAKDDDGSEAASAASMKDTKHNQHQQAPEVNDEKEEKEGKSSSLAEDDYSTELQTSNHTRQGEVVPVGVDWMSVAVVLLSVLVAVLLVRKYQRHNG